MPEQWDFYFTSIDDRPASISLDLGRAESGPAREWPWLVCLRIPMRSPRPDGLSSGQEAPILNTLEDALADAVVAVCDGAQVGRLTWNGFRELFLYVRGVEQLQESIGAALSRAQAPDYDVLVRTENDPVWRHYFEFLFPSQEQMYWIHDRRVVDQLVAAGDQVEAPRPVDHYAYFGDRGALDRFLSAAASLGFRGNALPTDQGRLGAHLVREDAVAIHHIHEVVSELRRLAEECGGEYDGWGCPVADASP